MNNKDPLCNTGSYTLYLIITYNGKEYVKEYIYIRICVYHFAIHQKPTQHCQSTIIQQQQQKKNKDIVLLSIQFRHSVMSDSLRPHGLQHTSLPVHHQFLELTQTHIHWVSDAIRPSHPLLSPSPPTFNLFQHQGLFQWVSSSHQVAKVLELQLQHQSFQRIFRTDFL